MHSNTWMILDWAGNDVFMGKLFDSFNDAEEFLSDQISDTYEVDRGEYEIVLVETKRAS